MISSDPSLVGFISTGHREHSLRLFWTCFCCIQHSTWWKIILCWRWSHWPMPPIPMSNQHVKRGNVLDPIFFNLCWLRSLSLPGWMIGIEPWSPEIDKIEHPAHGIPNIGAVISACGLHGLLAGKAEGTIYFMAALHWLYMVNIIHWFISGFLRITNHK